MKDNRIAAGARSLRYGTVRRGNNRPVSEPRPDARFPVGGIRKPVVPPAGKLPNGDPPSLVLWGEEG